jgi:DNA repair exonuclease SbcCD ATPase subunit
MMANFDYPTGNESKKVEDSNQMTRTWSWHHTATAALAAALIGGNIYFMQRANQLERELNGRNAVLEQQVSELRDLANASTRVSSRTMDELRAQLEDTRGRSASDLKRMHADAQKHANQLVQKLADAERKREEEVLTKIGEVRQETETANTKVAGLATDVTNVKTEFQQAKSTLDETIATLKSVRGDLGVQSGLIATNAQELAALRALGERNYVEFTLNKGREPQKVGGVMIQVKKVDTKRNKFTLDLVADDKRIEKRDRTVNEPIQFYSSGARQPYEIVVNRVGKDQIAGYLSAPKVQFARQ